VNAFPELSVVLVAHDFGDSIERSLGCLDRQTALPRMEVVVVLPVAGPDEARALRESHPCAPKVVEHGPVSSRGSAAVTGIARAGGPIVALLENHSYPDPEWAAGLIEAHAGPWAIVGPSVSNENPRTLTSRANFLLSYGRWTEPVQAGEVDLLPFHNSAYDADWLRGHGERLGALLEEEGRLQRHVMAGGGRLFLEPRARTSHVNEERLGRSLGLMLSFGRVFGEERAETWSRARRILYACAFPLIPLANVPRVRSDARRTGATGLDLVVVLALHMAAHGVGEAIGYLLGAGRARRRIAVHEFFARDDELAAEP